MWGWIKADLFSTGDQDGGPPGRRVGLLASAAQRAAPPAAGPGLLDELIANPMLDDHDVTGLLAILMHTGMATATAVLTSAIAQLDASGLLAAGVDQATVPAIVRETFGSSSCAPSTRPQPIAMPASATLATGAPRVAVTAWPRCNRS